MKAFDKRLVLNKWLMTKLGFKSFIDLKELVSHDSNIGFTEEGNSKYLWKLLQVPEASRQISDEQLYSYDENIVKFWKQITKKRNNSGQVLLPLYFQYLSLLFTEVYLDLYFKDKDWLLSELNSFLNRFHLENKIKEKDYIEHFLHGDLNKLAFWIATGGGKTLLMHVNIKQFKFYSSKHRIASTINKIILLTPNEGLSKQHLKEFEKSDICASIFNPESEGYLFQSDVDIIDIHKLKEKKGEKTVAIDSFESNNLVLVDEGHRGASGDDWLQKRNSICAKGFSFEYSATFGQAIMAANKTKQKILSNLYSKCILFNYSYKYFHEDGYGKDHFILNLEEDKLSAQRQLYLTACLLGFFEQRKYFSNKKVSLAQYLIENPLWIFVGGSVTGNRKSEELSDIQQIILFISRFVENKSGESIENLSKLLNRKDDLRDRNNSLIFSRMFDYLIKEYKLGSEKELFNDILYEVFNTGAKGLLHVVHLKGGTGEIGLRVGGGDFFGVINVGDSGALIKKCETIEGENIFITDQSFSTSLFSEINTKDSTITTLIGAKKFTEGWSSWRVSTMGLMNVGRSEGSEIIQLFGRGIRLKGYGFSLKRSAYANEPTLNPPDNISKLETLNVFGVRSSYMEEFENYLKEEGVGGKNSETIILPTIQHEFPDDLHVVRPDKNIAPFKEAEKPILSTPPENFKNKIVLNWYPKIKSKGGSEKIAGDDVLNEGSLSPLHLSMINFDNIYFSLYEYKNTKARYNIQLCKDSLKQILKDNSWYTLYIPEYHLEIKSFSDKNLFEDIAIALLKKYLESFYSFKKNEYEAPYLEYQVISKTDKNFIKEYKAIVDGDEASWIERLKEFSALLNQPDKSKIPYPLEFGQLKLYKSNLHLYEPLVRLKNNEIIKISPVPMNDGENDFVESLEKYYTESFKYFENKEVYLLRNQSKEGEGFFLAGNFYPDFILWVKSNQKQYVNFIDPKGLRQLSGFDDPKINFHKTLKLIESKLERDEIILNSFIISNTPRNEIKWWCNGGDSKAQFSNNHVLFQEDSEYIKNMFELTFEANA